jgi:uncharacterized cupredoxin-like copper-binding protein
LRTELAAGDSTWIELIFNAPAAKSSAGKSAAVTTNDTVLGKINISFRANVAEPTDSALKLTADPNVLDFGPIEKKRRPKLETDIKNTTQEVMELAIVAVPPDYFKKVELDDTRLKPGKKTTLKVELTKEKENEQFRKTITLEARFQDKGKFRLTVPVIKGYTEEATAKKQEEKKEGKK